MGVAYDSIMQVVTIAGVTAAVFLLISLASRYRTPPAKRGVFKKMPLLLPALAFVFAVVLSYMYAPLPISAYRGANTGEIGIPHQPQTQFSVYDAGTVYYNRIDFRVGEYMLTDYSLEVTVRIYDGTVLISTATLNLDPPLSEGYVEDEESISMNPGTYNLTAECRFYIDDELQEDVPYVTVHMSQPIRPEIVKELVDWSSYQFFLSVGSISFILLGLCFGSEERTRRRIGSYDEEPRRDGEVYGRRWSSPATPSAL